MNSHPKIFLAEPKSWENFGAPCTLPELLAKEHGEREVRETAVALSGIILSMEWGTSPKAQRAKGAYPPILNYSKGHNILSTSGFARGIGTIKYCAFDY